MYSILLWWDIFVCLGMFSGVVNVELWCVCCC